MRLVCALLVCFTDRKRAARARRTLEKRLESVGDVVLDTTVLQVDQRHKASVYDPRRVIAGASTSLLTWGLFGLLSGGVPSLVLSGILGAVWGGAMAYTKMHHATTAELGRLGKQLPARSSALLTFAETSDAHALLDAAAEDSPSVASVAEIADDLTARVLTTDGESPPSAQLRTGLSMIVLRYPDGATARTVASRVAEDDGPHVELIVETDQSGRVHVADPKFGVAAVARYNVVSWGVLGVVCGAVAGWTGGDGFVGFLEGGLLTGLAWGLFGAGAGALYGLWAGRATSARRLKGIGAIVAPGTSTLVAWADGYVGTDGLDVLAGGPGTQRLVLGFLPTDRGAILNAA